MKVHRSQPVGGLTLRLRAISIRRHRSDPSHWSMNSVALRAQLTAMLSPETHSLAFGMDLFATWRGTLNVPPWPNTPS